MSDAVDGVDLCVCEELVEPICSGSREQRMVFVPGHMCRRTHVGVGYPVSESLRDAASDAVSADDRTGEIDR